MFSGALREGVDVGRSIRHRGVRAADVDLERPNIDPQRPIEVHIYIDNKARVVVGTGRAANCRLRNDAGGSSHTKVEANHDKLAFSRESNGVVSRSVLAERTKRVGKVRSTRHGGMKCVWVYLRENQEDYGGGLGSSTSLRQVVAPCKDSLEDSLQ